MRWCRRYSEAQDVVAGENAAYVYQWDRLATGRRQSSLHMDVRFLACPSDTHMPHSPPVGLLVNQYTLMDIQGDIQGQGKNSEDVFTLI